MPSHRLGVSVCLCTLCNPTATCHQEGRQGFSEGDTGVQVAEKEEPWVREISASPVEGER